MRVAIKGQTWHALRVVPVNPPGTDELSFLVLFETTTHPWTRDVPEPTSLSTAERDVEWLPPRVASSKQYVQSVVDQHDMVTQDLRAAHEEVLSSNEELKSTNELETTKEELQSANEELTTVNRQYRIVTRNSVHSLMIWPISSAVPTCQW